MNKLYSVHDHWTDINKKNDVDIESIDGVITGIKVNGEDYGGGEEPSGFPVMVYTREKTQLYYAPEAYPLNQKSVQMNSHSGVIITAQPRYIFSIAPNSNLRIEPMAGEFEEVTQYKKYVVNGETLFAIVTPLLT